MNVPPRAVACGAVAIQRFDRGDDGIAPSGRRCARGNRAPRGNRSPSGGIQHVRLRRARQRRGEGNHRHGRVPSAFRAVESTSSTGGVIGTAGGFIETNNGYVVAKIGFERLRRRSGGRSNATDRCESWVRHASATARQECCETARISPDDRLMQPAMLAARRVSFAAPRMEWSRALAIRPVAERQISGLTSRLQSPGQKA